MKQEHIHPGPHFEKSKSQLLFHARTDMLNQQRKHTVRYIFKQLIHSQIHSPQKKKKKISRKTFHQGLHTLPFVQDNRLGD